MQVTSLYILISTISCCDEILVLLKSIKKIENPKKNSVLQTRFIILQRITEYIDIENYI